MKVKITSKVKKKIAKWLCLITTAIGAVAVITLLGLAIWANIKYANVPVGEIPFWLVWLFWIMR